LASCYDLSGNRISNVIAGGASPHSLTFDIDPASNRLLSFSGTSSQSFSYDAAGNTTALGAYRFAYDARGRMVSSTQGAIVYDYSLNGLGQRVGKTEVGGPPTTFVYDGAGRMIGRYNSTVTYEEHVYLGDFQVALLEPGGPYYVVPDHLGSPHQVTNGAGQIVWFWDHGAFGPAQPTGALVSFKDRFPGQFYDLETGLHYNGFRDYAPTLGRYLESDPIGLRGGINSYAYAKGNPLTLSDIRGLCPAYGPDCIDTVYPELFLAVPPALRQLGGLLRMLEPDTTGLPPDGVLPPVTNPQKCVIGFPSRRGSSGLSLYDENGGEWRYFGGDDYHNPHWDYNSWTNWNSPWQNVPIGNLPPVK